MRKNYCLSAVHRVFRLKFIRELLNIWFRQLLQAPASVDRELLFGNMVDVVELSQRMLNCFETSVVGKPFDEQIVGKVLALV